MKYSIIIPVYNEGTNILKLSRLIKKNLKNKIYEVIFVDDNSNDGSKDESKKIKFKNFKYFIRKKKKDLSESCIDGIRLSKFNNIVIMDGDLQHQPSCLFKMMNEYEKKKPNILVGTRNFKNLKGLHFMRKFMSLFLIFLINNFLKKKTNDPMSGFFIIQKRLFYRIENRLYKKGFKILTDIIYSSNKINIIDLSINFQKRKKNKSKMSLKILFHILILILSKKINTFTF